MHILISECLPTLTAAGTLVVSIPTREGLVVAADSRTTVQGEHFDGTAKLRVAEVHRPVLFTVTGTSDFADAPPTPMPLADWMPVATYQYRSSTFVKAHLEKQPDAIVSTSSTLETGEALARSLNEYFLGRPAGGLTYCGQELCRLVLFQSASKGTMQWASVLVSVNAQGRAQVDPSSASSAQYDASDEKAFSYFGEDRYTTEHVLSKGVLDQQAADMWSSKTRIADLSAEEAALVARGIIGAAEITTRSVPVPSGNGIGGPVMVYLVASGSVTPLRW